MACCTTPILFLFLSPPVRRCWARMLGCASLYEIERKTCGVAVLPQYNTTLVGVGRVWGALGHSSSMGSLLGRCF